jgi:serine/threonine protein kinase
LDSLCPLTHRGAANPLLRFDPISVLNMELFQFCYSVRWSEASISVTAMVRAKELDARSDLFSFGAVLYEMATGALPFHGESSAVICEAIMNRAPVAVVRLNHDAPPRPEDIINRR